MRPTATRLVFLFAFLLSALTASAQPPAAATSVPRVVRLTGIFVPANGMSPAPVETIALAIYGNESGGAPLWQETQYVALDSSGRYTVLLGATQPDGLPLDIFASGDARWVGRRFERAGEQEQARVSLPSVPYALKAADADTLGGLPPSAYLLADPTVASGSTSVGGSATPATSTASAPQALTSGTAGCIGEFTNTTDLGCSPMVDVGGAIGLGTATPFDRFHVRFTNTTGAFTGLAVQNLGSTASSYSGMLFYDQSGALGQFQGFNNSTHEYRVNNIASSGSINFLLAGTSKFKVRTDGNIEIPGDIYKSGSVFLSVRGADSVGLGPGALANYSGLRSNAFGLNALGHTGNSGFYNTAIGTDALGGNTSGGANTALGDSALTSNSTGNSNTAVGIETLANVRTGGRNTAVGSSALSNTGGSDNTALGFLAGANIFGSSNLMLANEGSAGDNGVVRIGTAGTHTTFFAAGIRGVTTGISNAVAIVIDGNGQLGTVNSSRRYKFDIRDMGDASSALMRLRPVTYRYTQPYADGSTPIDYGLIAEEVEEVYPDLVAHLQNGEVETVQYQKINAMLLNEVQKQHRTIEELEARLSTLERLLGSAR